MREKEFKQLKIISIEPNNVWCLCPWHEDSSRPNLSISLNPEYIGRYKCWACNRDGRLNMEQIAHLDLKANNEYKHDYTMTPKMMTRWLQYTKDCKGFLERYPLLKISLAKQLGVPTKALDDWRVGWDGNAYTIPMYTCTGAYRDGGIVGVIRRFPDGTKKAVYGSRLGWMFPVNGHWDETTLYICEGFTDALALHNLGKLVVARPNCHYVEGVESLVAEFSEEVDLNVIIVPDNDKVGIEGATKLLDIISARWNCMMLHFTDSKDIREYINRRGKDNTLKLLHTYEEDY